MFTRRQVLGSAVAAAFAMSGARASEPLFSLEELQHEWDVIYDDDDPERQELDVLRPPDRPEPRPAVILIHGGGLVTGSRFEFIHHADALAQAGYVTVNIDYRLYSPREGTNTWPVQLDDVQRAVRWVRANAAKYNIDPERVGTYGWSSGGQLTGFLAVRETRDNSDTALADYSSRVTCAVAMAGTFDTSIPYPNTYDTEIDALVLGGSLEDLPSAEAYLDFSPINFVDENAAPLLLLHGTRDSVTPVENSRVMEAAMHEAGAFVTYAEFPDFDHVEWGVWANSAPETLAFFDRFLEPDK